MDVGQRIKKLREGLGLEQMELAHRINISQSKMNKIETGYQKRIEPDILVDLSKELGATVDYIVGKSDNPNQTEEESFEEFINDPDLRRWHKELPKSDEEDLRRLKRIWDAYKED